MSEITNYSYGNAKMEQMLSNFKTQPTRNNVIQKSNDDELEKGLKGRLDTSHLVLKQVNVGGKMMNRWVDPTKGDKEHAKHGSTITFEHKGEKKRGTVGTVMGTGEYSIKADDGKTYAKHPHQFDSPHADSDTDEEETETSSAKGENSEDKHVKVYEADDIIAHTVSKEKLETLDKEAEDDGDINMKFKDYAKYVRMVAKGTIKSGIAYGTGGVGKTFTAIHTLETTINPKTKKPFREFNEETDTPGADNYDYVKITGKATTSGVIQAMWEHNGKLLLFDDCDTALTQPDTVMIFKGALDSTGDGKISALSARPLKDSDGEAIPKTFKFTGRAFFISNLKGSQIDQAIKSRSLRVDLSMDATQTLERIKFIAEDKQGKLTNIKLKDVDGNKINYTHEDMDAAIKFLEKYKDKTGDLNVRTLGNIVRLIHDGKEEGETEHEWKSAAKSFILAKSNEDELNDELEKAEGSRGGKVIGHTKSGKPIYENANHDSHSNFTINDHNDARVLHTSLRNKEKEGSTERKFHFNQTRIHSDAYDVKSGTKAALDKLKLKKSIDKDIDLNKAFDILLQVEPDPIDKAFSDLLGIEVNEPMSEIEKSFEDLFNIDQPLKKKH